MTSSSAVLQLNVLGVCISAGYWAFSNASDKLGIKKTAKKARKGAEKVAAFDEDEWVKGTPYEVEKRRRANAAKKQ